MKKEILLPEISENVTSGEVVNVLVSIGDHIEKDQSIIELETEKAAVEVPSPFAGEVVEIKIKSGDTINIGDVIMVIETEAGKEKKVDQIKTEKKDRKKENKEELLKEKATIERKEKIEKDYKENNVLKEEKKWQEVDKIKQVDIVPASPSVRRFARELGLDISNIKGSGPGGRISFDDIKNYNKQKQPIVTTSQTSVDLPDFSQWGEIRRETMTKVRQLTSESTTRAWQIIPHVTQYDKADITLLNQFMDSYKKTAEKKGIKLTITSVLIKILSHALKKYPRFNASLDIEKKEIIYKNYINIGVAVDTDRGLLVPVIHDIDKKNLMQIASELSEIAEKTRNKKITPEEMKGGNFTVSNLGSIGGTNFTPIIFWPQVAILGVSRTRIEPVFIDNKFEPRPILPLALSYDHRIIDGADGIRFLNWLTKTIENPFYSILEET